MTTATAIATVGQCLECVAPAEPGRARCQRHLAMNRRTASKRRAGRVAAGQCVDCQSPARAGHQRCSGCAGEMRARDNARYLQSKMAGVCIRPGCWNRTQGTARCLPCAAHASAGKRAAYARRKAKAAARQVKSERARSAAAGRKSLAIALGQYPEWLRDAMAAAELCLAGCGSDVGRGGPFCAGCMPKA